MLGIHDSILRRRREEDVLPPVMTASRVPPVHPRALLESKSGLTAMQTEAKIRYRQREGAQNRINLLAALEPLPVSSLQRESFGGEKVRRFQRNDMPIVAYCLTRHTRGKAERASGK